MSFIWKGGNGGSGSNDCPFDGEITEPVWGSTVSGTTCQDFKRIFFTALPPLQSISGNPSFGLYEYHTTVDNPILNQIAHRNSNGADLVQMLWYHNGTLLHTVDDPDYDTTYSYQDTISIIDTYSYVMRVVDAENNIVEHTGTYEFTWAFFGTTNDITVLTKQPLWSLNSHYFQLNMVAEDDTHKQTAEFHNSITITGVQVYNTNSGNWEWIGQTGSPNDKSNSLNYFDTNTVVKDIHGTNENYIQYFNNTSKIGARQLRFWRV